MQTQLDKTPKRPAGRLIRSSRFAAAWLFALALCGATAALGKTIPTDTSVGTWDSVNRIYKLTTNVYEGLEVVEDNLVLDGNGYLIQGSGSGAGVTLTSRTGVTLKQLTVINFYDGIHLLGSHFNTIDGNYLTENLHGGILLRYSNHNILVRNAVAGHHGEGGIWLWGGSDWNDVTLNNSSGNPGGYGIYLDDNCQYNTLTWNIASGDYIGIRLNGSPRNRVLYNTVSHSTTWGMDFWGATLNEVYNNNFIDNPGRNDAPGQIRDFTTGNVYYQLPPVGGNYWNDWTGPDADNNGFVDNPYLFSYGRDDYPLTKAVSQNNPPVAQCKSVTIPAGSNCTADASIDNGSYDPDGDPITITQSPPGPYGLGSTQVTLTVADSNGASNQCTATVTVIDNTPPTINILSASPTVLWPPNKKMVSVIVSASPSDHCGGVSCKVISVSSNEPPNSDAIATGDAVKTGDLSLNLRADRLGNGTGRIYSITVQCMDGSGNISTKSVAVNVPHDKSNDSNSLFRVGAGWRRLEWKWPGIVPLGR